MTDQLSFLEPQGPPDPDDEEREPDEYVGDDPPDPDDDEDVELTAEEEELTPEEVPALEPAATPKVPAKPEEPAKPQVIVDDPYDWYQCQITLAVTWLPREEGKEEREVIVMGRTHDDAPIIHLPIRSGEILGREVTEAMESVLVGLMSTLEDRGQARAEKVAAAKAEAEKQKAEAAKREAERQERMKNRPQGQAYTPPPAKPSINSALFKDTDAMNAMNVSETMLKMLESLRNNDNQEWKKFKATWKDQPTLELMFAGYIIAEGEKVKITDKGKAVYEKALAWKPGEKSAGDKPKEQAGPPAKQTSLF